MTKSTLKAWQKAVHAGVIPQKAQTMSHFLSEKLFSLQMACAFLSETAHWGKAFTADSVAQLLMSIIQRAPNAKVLIAGYPDIVPASSCSDGGFVPTTDLDLLRPVIGELNAHIQDAVDIVARDTGHSVTFARCQEGIFWA